MSYPPPSQYPPVLGADPGARPRLRGQVPRILGWVFLGVGIAAIVIGAVLAVGTVKDIKDFQRVSISTGSGSVDVQRTGTWVGYYEASNVSDGIRQLPDLDIAVTDPTGAPVPHQNYGNRSDGKVKKSTYSIDGHHGVALLQFDAKTKGTYQVRVQAQQTLPPGADVAFGEDVLNASTIGGVLGVLAGILLVIAAIVLLIVGYVKRSHHKRELATGWPGAGGYAVPMTGYGPPPGGFGPSWDNRPYPGAPGAYGPPPLHTGVPTGSGFAPPPSYPAGPAPAQQPPDSGSEPISLRKPEDGQ